MRNENREYMWDKPDKFACQGGVYHRVSSNWGETRQCTREGKYEEDGKHWCGIHRPSVEVARLQRSQDKFEAKMAGWRLDRAIQAKETEIIQAVMLWHDGPIEETVWTENAATVLRLAKELKELRGTPRS